MPRNLSPALLERIESLDGCRGRWIVDCRNLEGGAGYALRSLDDAAHWPMPDCRVWAAVRPEDSPHKRGTPEDAATYCAATGWQSRLLWCSDWLDDDNRWPGGYDAPSIIRSNARVFRDNFAKELERADGDADGLSLDVRYVTAEMLETLHALEDYPLISEDDHSNLELELQAEAWESWGREDWRKAISKRLEDLAPDSDDPASWWADETAEQISDATLDSWFYSASDAAGICWEEQTCGGVSEGFWVDLERIAQTLTREDLAEIAGLETLQLEVTQ